MFYVYVWRLYGVPAYVGKGVWGRWHRHKYLCTGFADALREANAGNQSEVAHYGYPLEQEAFDEEERLIDLWGRRGKDLAGLPGFGRDHDGILFNELKGGTGGTKAAGEKSSLTKHLRKKVQTSLRHGLFVDLAEFAGNVDNSCRIVDAPDQA